MTDSTDFDALYAATAPRMMRTLHLLTGDKEEARDCVQEAFERAWVRWPKVSSEGAPEAWVRTVARRLAISRWRKLRNANTAWARHRNGADADSHDHASGSTDRLALVDALQQLPVAQRTAIVLHHLCDLDVAAVAAETGTSVTAVKSQRARGRRALADLIGEPEPSCPATVDDACPVSPNRGPRARRERSAG